MKFQRINKMILAVSFQIFPVSIQYTDACPRRRTGICWFVVYYFIIEQSQCFEGILHGRNDSPHGPNADVLFLMTTFNYRVFVHCDSCVIMLSLFNLLIEYRIKKAKVKQKDVLLPVYLPPSPLFHFQQPPLTPHHLSAPHPSLGVSSHNPRCVNNNLSLLWAQARLQSLPSRLCLSKH